ncbi:YerC/YecD family TrpR-related protein [Patescibacteria group bacterium]
MKWYNAKTKELFKIILSLKNQREAKMFFRDLLTEAEVLEFANRWQAAKMLGQGISYTKISRETGLSSTTVARVAKWLRRGRGGYKLGLKRLNINHHQSPHAKSPPGKGLS